MTLGKNQREAIEKIVATIRNGIGEFRGIGCKIGAYHGKSFWLGNAHIRGSQAGHNLYLRVHKHDDGGNYVARSECIGCYEYGMAEHKAKEVFAYLEQFLLDGGCLECGCKEAVIYRTDLGRFMGLWCYDHAKQHGVLEF